MDVVVPSVLDASALLAYLQDEPGSSVVQQALAAGAFMSVVNYAEVLSRLADAGEDPATAHRTFYEQGLVGGLLELVTAIEDDASRHRPTPPGDPSARPLSWRP